MGFVSIYTGIKKLITPFFSTASGVLSEKEIIQLLFFEFQRIILYLPMNCHYLQV